MDELKQKRGKVTSVHLEEARLLKEIWDRTKEARKSLGIHSQGAFGQEFSVGNQAAVGFFLNGKTALSLKAARGFAKGLGCTIADFSPRLAAQDTSWPFELVDRERYDALPPAMRFKAQVRMMDEIELLERAVLANGTHS